MTDDSSNPPEWSGAFWEDGDQGWISIHISDTRHHRPPEGWRLIGILEEPDGDTETHYFTKAKP